MNSSDYSPGVEKYMARGQAAVAQANEQRANMRRKKFDTIAVHGMYDMQAALANQGSIIEPAYLASAQHFENSDHLETALAYLMPAWGYTRLANPTMNYLEETIALLESYGCDCSASAMATSSGMSAVFMATNPFLENPELKKINFVAAAKCYGGTFMLFAQRYMAERGIEVRWVKNPLDLDEWASKIDDHTRFVFGEMPSNPGLALLDIAALAKLAHAHDLPLLVDSTVATAALMRPLQHGADIVIHSVSKSMATSGFTIAGALISRDQIPSRVGPQALRENFAQYAKLLPGRDYGPALSPFNALMALNDLRTLRMRMDYTSRSAMTVAQFLGQHKNVEAVSYPGLSAQPGYDIAARYMWLVDGADDYGQEVNRFGALLSFNVRGGIPSTRQVFDKLQMIWRATDLGRIKSIATIPAISTHQQQGDTGRDLADVASNMIRLSVGAEHSADIIADLEQALDSVSQ